MPERELIEPNQDDKRYARRDEQGHFTEQDDVGQAAATDQQREAEHPSKPGQGDKGDRES